MNNLEQIKSMLPPRDSYPRMMVWERDESKAVERIVAAVNKDGSCYAINSGYEQRFLNNKKYSTTCWPHCKPIQKPSAEPWTDRLKIMNWCHQQAECVLIGTVVDCGLDIWSQYCFDTDRLDDYRWNKINPETNELMYADNKIFCDAECLGGGEV